ncbi:hypothetical protein KY334_01475 [Candidatus Woesearchaeota archaeon]|nr:hypothetical protein [Candidatus Woesearchaeota archaeon]
MAIKNKEKNIIYGIFLVIYLFLIYYNHINDSKWLIDNVLSIALITFIFLISGWLKLDKYTFVLFNLALLTHNLGTFDFYSWSYSFIEYDMIVHFFNSLVGGIILFNFVVLKLHLNKKETPAHKLISEHKLIMIILVIALVTTLGTMVELLEFFGFSFLGTGDGILFYGSGDGIFQNYSDTMVDVLVNLIGAIFGVIIYYLKSYKKIVSF